MTIQKPRRSRQGAESEVRGARRAPIVAAHPAWRLLILYFRSTSILFKVDRAGRERPFSQRKTECELNNATLDSHALSREPIVIAGLSHIA